MAAEADDGLREELARHDMGLAAYFDQDWDKAAEMFAQLHDNFAGRQLYSLYKSRIEQLRGAGLSAGWDGVFVHTQK
jgi:hypothetical protein